MAGQRRRVLLALVLAAAALSVGVAVSWLISSWPELLPCPDDVDSSPASASPVAGFCLPISRGAVLALMCALMFALGMLITYLAIRVYKRFADGDDEDQEAARAKKAGYVDIFGDDAEAGVGGGKN